MCIHFLWLPGDQYLTWPSGFWYEVRLKISLETRWVKGHYLSYIHFNVIEVAQWPTFNEILFNKGSFWYKCYSAEVEAKILASMWAESQKVKSEAKAKVVAQKLV